MGFMPLLRSWVCWLVGFYKHFAPTELRKGVHWVWATAACVVPSRPRPGGERGESSVRSGMFIASRGPTNVKPRRGGMESVFIIVILQRRRPSGSGFVCRCWPWLMPLLRSWFFWWWDFYKHFAPTELGMEGGFR